MLSAGTARRAAEPTRRANPAGAVETVPRRARTTAVACRTTELAQARDALGLITVVVSEGSSPSAHLDLRVVPEWATTQPCLDPATLGSACTPTAFPSGVSAEIPWARLRSCRATPTSPVGALVVDPGGSCPLATVAAPRCLLGSPRMAPPRQAFELNCRALIAEEASHPDPIPGARAAFRCVVPESALVGTTTSV